MKNIKILIASAALSASLLVPTGLHAADDIAVKITAGIASVDVMHNGKQVTIMRNQDQTNTVSPAFSKTSRKCPPFCIQPMTLAPGVETIGEIEMLDYLKRMSDGDSSILVVDSRTPDWVKRGTIPGSVNLPWTRLNPARGADPLSIGEILTGKVKGRGTAEEITLFKSLGLAIEDLASAHHIYQKAQEKDLGTWVEIGGEYFAERQ